MTPTETIMTQLDMSNDSITQTISTPQKGSARVSPAQKIRSPREMRRIRLKDQSDDDALLEEKALEELASLHSPYAGRTRGVSPKRQPLYVMCPVCHTWRDSVHDLKSHYRASHTGTVSLEGTSFYVWLANYCMYAFFNAQNAWVLFEEQALEQL